MRRFGCHGTIVISSVISLEDAIRWINAQRRAQLEQEDDLLHSCMTAFEALKHEEMRDWELLQLSKHVQEFRQEFNDADSLKLLETTLETNAQLVRREHEQM